MKSFLLLFIFSIVLLSCSTDNGIDKVKEETEQYLIGQLKDPSSYQKISIEVIDSVTKSQSMEEDFDLNYSEASIELGVTTNSEKESALNTIKKLKANPKLDSLEYIKLLVKYRAKNSFGALDSQESMIYHFRKPEKVCCMIFEDK
jgi:hypothetical protein